MTISAAGNASGRVGDKEKVEKRRALGRGLESLLPGPRVVGAPGQSSGAAGTTQVHRFARKDKTYSSDQGVGEPVPGKIRAEVEEFVAEPSLAGAPAPHEIAELRSGGQPGAAVPTRDLAEHWSDDTPSETITIYAQAESPMPGNLGGDLAIAPR